MRTAFNWSRSIPSKDGVSQIYIAAPNAYGKFNRDITKAELIHQLRQYNTIEDLERKKHALRTSLFTALASIPFIVMFYNLFINVWN